MGNYRGVNGRSNSKGVNGSNYNVIRDFSELGIVLLQKWGCPSWYAVRNGENGPVVNVKKDDVSILFGEDKEAVKSCLKKYFERP